MFEVLVDSDNQDVVFCSEGCAETWVEQYFGENLDWDRVSICSVDTEQECDYCGCQADLY